MTQSAKQIPSEVEESLINLENVLKEKYPGGIPRKDVGKATGGILHPRTCRNEDSLGNGIPGRFRVGRNTIYPISGTMTKIRSKLVVV